jgi:hypothetical protein
MSHATLLSIDFSSLPPWLGQRHHQLMVPPLPIGLRKAHAIGLGSAAVGSLVWGANASPIKKQRGRRGLVLRWLPLCGKT